MAKNQSKGGKGGKAMTQTSTEKGSITVETEEGTTYVLPAEHPTLRAVDTARLSSRTMGAPAGLTRPSAKTSAGQKDLPKKGTQEKGLKKKGAQGKMAITTSSPTKCEAMNKMSGFSGSYEQPLICSSCSEDDREDNHARGGNLSVLAEGGRKRLRPKQRAFHPALSSNEDHGTGEAAEPVTS